MATVGDNIKRLRLQAGWSQEQLAKKIGKTRSVISQYEKGVCLPRMGVVEDMASAFGVTKRDIIEDLTRLNAPTNLSEMEVELVVLFRQVSPKGRRAIITGLRDLVESE